ncbi:uncharacterized protein LOC120005269 isoform X2 [Tripterygium wilfordii]|uniref:uncharacterized protein LOC120005269 isoform X2 n=1 Tax=Tripterygium wilfordii TaxID=458696 RepID=UPI0018F83AC6|nr:uncharacterized protein LOC120005269 isoform X2 [Tripterygium wilfordii]
MKKPIKRNRKRLMKSVLDYLKSDTYMFSPLISSDFRVSKMKKPMKPINKRLLLKSVVDYLKSDTYLFAPLFSNKPSCFTEPKTPSSSCSSFSEEMKEKSGGDSLGLLTKYGEFLKSDSFMYGPLVAPLHVSSSIGSSHHVKKITVEVSPRKLTSKNDQSANGLTENVFSEENVSETSILGRQSLRHRESVKHIIHHSYRPTSVSGKRILRSQLSNFI